MSRPTERHDHNFGMPQKAAHGRGFFLEKIPYSHYHLIMAPVEDIIKKMNQRGNVSSSNQDLIRRAFACAQKAHVNQKRRSGIPYFDHPISVALSVSEMGLDASSKMHIFLSNKSKKNSGRKSLFLLTGLRSSIKSSFTEPSVKLRICEKCFWRSPKTSALF